MDKVNEIHESKKSLLKCIDEGKEGKGHPAHKPSSLLIGENIKYIRQNRGRSIIEHMDEE